MSVVTMGTTLTNPEILDEQQLREALERANGELIQKDLQIHQLNCSVSALSVMVSNLCELHIANRFADFNAEIERITGIYKQMKAAMSARKVH